MPRSLGAKVPESLRPLLDGHDLEGSAGLTLLLLTTGESGWPHVAMLSAGEVLATAGAEVRLALWAGSHTTANLERTGKATLMAVVPPATYYLRLVAGGPPREASVGGHPRAVFVTEVEEALEDVVAYAEVTSGIRFDLPDREKVLAAWRGNLEAMRSA